MTTNNVTSPASNAQTESRLGLGAPQRRTAAYMLREAEMHSKRRAAMLAKTAAEHPEDEGDLLYA